MGCDGGTIPTRDEMVRLKKKPEKKDKDAVLAAKWRHCAISQEALQQPIVACELGRLYNKDKVIEFLLDRSKFELAENFEHIKGLKDVKELKLTENAAYNKDAAEKGGYVDRGIAEFMCPVTGLETSGRYRFIMIWGCGCVVAERALKEIKSENCNKCQKPFKPQDVIILNGNEEDFTKMKANMEERKIQAKLEKKAKKKQKLEAAAGSADQLSDEPAAKQSKLDGSSTVSSHSTQSNGSNQSEENTATTKLTNGLSNGVKSRSVIGSKIGAGTKLGASSVNGKTKKIKGIQHDPATSVVFKSLFTTSEKAKNQPKGPWVTHDPRFN